MSSPPQSPIPQSPIMDSQPPSASRQNPRTHPDTKMTYKQLVRLELRNMWDSKKNTAQGDLLILYSHIRLPDYEAVTKLLLPTHHDPNDFSFPISFGSQHPYEKWAKQLAGHLIRDYADTDDNSCHILAKKVGRLIIIRSLLSHFPTGPHTYNNVAFKKNIANFGIGCTHENLQRLNWPDKCVDYLLQNSDLKWMANHVDGETLNKDPSSKEFKMCTENEKYFTNYAYDMNHNGPLEHYQSPRPRSRSRQSPKLRTRKSPVFKQRVRSPSPERAVKRKCVASVDKEQEEIVRYYHEELARKATLDQQPSLDNTHQQSPTADYEMEPDENKEDVESNP